MPRHPTRLFLCAVRAPCHRSSGSSELAESESPTGRPPHAHRPPSPCRRSSDQLRSAARAAAPVPHRRRASAAARCGCGRARWQPPVHTHVGRRMTRIKAHARGRPRCVANEGVHAMRGGGLGAPRGEPDSAARRSPMFEHDCVHLLASVGRRRCPRGPVCRTIVRAPPPPPQAGSTVPSGGPAADARPSVGSAQRAGRQR